MKLSVVHIPDLLLKLGAGWSESELCRVQTISTRRWQVEVPEGPDLARFTVWQLKRLLEDQHGLSADEQVVRFRGRALDDAEPLVSCGVGPGAALLLGLLGAQRQAPDAAADGDAPVRCKEKVQGSLTTTEVSAPEGPGGGGGGSQEPWWSSSRLSGPQNAASRPGIGGGAGAAPAAHEACPGAALPAAVPAAAAAGASAAAGAEGPGAEELRRRRLLRFG